MHAVRPTATGQEHTYATHLRGAEGTSSRVVVRVGDHAPASALDRFLLPRWGLHVAHLGRSWYFPVAHPPWSVRHAEAQVLDVDRLMASVGLGELAGRRPGHVAFSDGVDADFGRPVLAGTPRRARLAGSVSGEE